MMPNSLKYLVFLALAAAGHAIAPKKLRNPLLLAVSWAFYLLSMPKFLPLLIVVTFLTWTVGGLMERNPDRKRALLIPALLACFGLGLGVPFMVFALGYEKLKGVVTLLKKHSQTIKYIGGGMLIIVGLSMVFNLFGYYLAIFN